MIRDHVGEADFVAFALLDLFLALRDEFKVALRRVPEGLPHRLRVQCAAPLRNRLEALQPLGHVVQPLPGAGLVVLVVETDEVGDFLLVVEGDKAIGEDECGIGGWRPCAALRAAVGLEFVAEVARIAAIEVERQALGVDVALAQLPVEVAENGFLAGRQVAAMGDRHPFRCQVVAHELRVRTAGITHVREAGEFADQGAVEPERRF